MYIVKHRSIFFAITGIITAISIGLIATFGLHEGIDFTGGVLAEAHYPNRALPSQEEITSALKTIGVENASMRQTGTDGYIIRTRPLTPAERASFNAALGVTEEIIPNVSASSTSSSTPVVETKQPYLSRFTEVGPTIGAELRTKALWAILAVILCIMLFIAFAFRHVSKPVSSWVYGVVAVITLLHDVIVPLGAFALFGHLWGAEVDTLLVTAILTILGFSIHDTIVVFDRTRENLRINASRNFKEDFEETVGHSVSQTIVRSINTSVTVLISLGVLYWFGPASTHDFALTLIVGIVAGTFSSIAFASPLLVTIATWQGNRQVAAAANAPKGKKK